MKKNAIASTLLVAAVALGLGSCAASSSTPKNTVGAHEFVPPTTESAPRDTPAPSPSATPLVPARADQDAGIRALAEATFVHFVKQDYPDVPYTDAQLVAAADAYCDSKDRGDSLQSSLIIVASLLPDMPSTDSIASLAGRAQGTICPEYATG